MKRLRKGNVPIPLLVAVQGIPDGKKGIMRNYERENLEFQITWSETNLRYLAGEPESENKTRCIKINEEGIAKCKARLKEMGQAGKGLHG